MLKSIIVSLACLALADQSEAAAPLGLAHKIFETPCYKYCDLREKGATAWCPDAQPYVCGVRVGTTEAVGDKTGVSKLWIKCCGKTTSSYVDKLVGGYNYVDTVHKFSNTALYFSGLRTQFEDDGGFGDQEGLLDVHGYSRNPSNGGLTEHWNGPSRSGDSDYKWTNKYCPSGYPYLCGARFRWEDGPSNEDDFGGITVEGKCCQVAAGYRCRSSGECGKRNGKSTSCSSGTCKCNFPWQNDDCSQCTDSRWGNSCANNVSCSQSRGNCIQNSCWGTKGNGKCTTCKTSSYYGATCEGTVTCNTNNGSCNHGSCHGPGGSGKCSSCKPGWAGPTCETKVDCSTFGGTCEEGSCKGVGGNGKCTSCKPGFFGRSCNYGKLYSLSNTTSCLECSGAERALVQQCPATHPFVCQLQVGARQNEGVANAQMRCCNNEGLVYGADSNGSVGTSADLSGVESQSTGEWSTKCTNFVSGIKYAPGIYGFTQLELLCGLQHENVDVPNTLLYGSTTETVTCPLKTPYVCGIRHYWSTNAPLGTTKFDLRCCSAPRDYNCNDDDQCDNPLDSCVTGTCQQTCPCKESSRWFQCTPDSSPGCYLSNAESPEICLSGPMESTVAAYENTVLNALQPFQLAGASTSQLEYYTAVSAIARHVYCVGQPYLGAVNNTYVEFLGTSLNKLAANLDATNIKKNLVDQSDGAVSGLLGMLNRIFTRKSQATTLYANAPMVPAYSLERVLSVQDTNPEAGFVVVDKWIEQKKAITDAIIEVKKDDAQFESFCTNLFEGLQSDTATEQAIQTKNLQELNQKLQTLFDSVNFSKDLFVDLQTSASEAATALNEAVGVMQKKIEEFENAKLAAELFDAIVQVVVAVGTLVAAAGATFFTAGAFAPTLAGAATLLLDSIEPLMEIADGVETMIDAAGGVDEPEILKLGSFDIGVDADEFVNSNADFRDNAVAVSKELFSLGKRLEQLLSQASSDPETFQDANIKGSTMNPQVWDVINLQLIASLESMRICEAPEISLDSRRLIESEHLRIRNGDSSSLELRRIGGVGDTNSLGRSLETKSKKAERLYEESKDSIDDMTNKCELFKIEWEKVTTAGKMLHTDIAGMVSLFRDIRVTSYAVNAYKKNADNWADKQKDGCGKVDKDAQIAVLNAQLEYAHVMEAEDLYSAQQRLWDTCETVQYVLNPDTQACDPEKVFGLRSIEAVANEWTNTKAKFIDAWREAISFEDVTYKKLDISNLVNMNALRNWDGLESPPVLEFTLTPDMISDNEKVDVRCNYNVEVSEMAVVFQGTKESTLYGTTVEMMGPFVKESKEGNAKVFIPTNRYKLGFKYKVGDSDATTEGACDTSASEFTTLCGKQLCAESGGDNLGLKKSGNVPWPSLFSRYRIKVDSFDTDSLFRDVGAVHLLFRGRFTKKQSNCQTTVTECAWAGAGASSDLALIIGGSIAGVVVAIGAGVGIWKATSKSSTAPVAAEAEDVLDTKADIVVDNPRFNMHDL